MFGWTSSKTLCWPSKSKTDSLSSYKVEWTRVHVVKNCLENELDHYLLGEMCAQAAVGVELQSKREHWAANDEDVTPRATQINSLISNELKNLPANNLNCEGILLSLDTLLHNLQCIQINYSRLRGSVTIFSFQMQKIVFSSSDLWTRRWKLLMKWKYPGHQTKGVEKGKTISEYKKERKSFSPKFHFNGTNRNVVRSTSNACRYWSDFCSKLINSLRIQLSESLCMETIELVRVKLFFISFRQELQASLINFSRNTNSIRVL